VAYGPTRYRVIVRKLRVASGDRRIRRQSKPGELKVNAPLQIGRGPGEETPPATTGGEDEMANVEITKSDEFNRVFSEWVRINPSTPAPECEECGKSLVGRDVVAGDYGWYCSRKCNNAVSEAMSCIASDASDRRAERRQMGISD
jgi:hypothetical protein